MFFNRGTFPWRLGYVFCCAKGIFVFSMLCRTKKTYLSPLLHDCLQLSLLTPPVIWIIDKQVPRVARKKKRCLLALISFIMESSGILLFSCPCTRHGTHEVSLVLEISSLIYHGAESRKAAEICANFAFAHTYTFKTCH